MPLVLTNKTTAEQYEALTEVDQRIEVPPRGQNCGCQTYQGMISGITPCAAERYVSYGGNLIRKKLVQDPPASNPVVNDDNTEKKYPK